MNTKTIKTAATKAATAFTPVATSDVAEAVSNVATLSTKPESTRKAAVSIDVFRTTITLNFANGKELSFDMLECDDEIITQAQIHGFKQKLADAAAIARNPETGASATADDKYNAVKEVFDRITAKGGQWNKNREGGETSPNLLIRALLEYRPGSSRDNIVAFLATKSKEEVAAIRKVPAIATIMARLSAEKANVNADEVLAGLDSI